MNPEGEELPSIIVPPPGPRSRQWGVRSTFVESPAVGARRAVRENVSETEQSPIFYEVAVGSNVTDVDGNRYVDLVAGFGSLALGHRPERLLTALQTQAGRLWLALGDVYSAKEKIRLCERLVELFPEKDAKVMLGLSGADAVTAALKTAALATGKPNVVAFSGAYHGLSYGPLAACGLNEGFRAPFRSQLGIDAHFAPYPRHQADLDQSLEAVQTALRTATVGAVLVEPTLGRGGCIVPPTAFLTELRGLCDRHNALLVADEIWTGLGRTGNMLESTAAGIVPDLICLGKALGGGLPISACVGRESVMAGWAAHGGTTIHTGTHFGAPLACGVACVLLDALSTLQLCERARALGQMWKTELQAATLGRGVKAVHGKGLMIGVELEGGAARTLAIVRALLVRGYLVLTGGTSGDILTFTPALTIKEDLLSGFTQTLSDVLAECKHAT